jgi:hypothetical protein
LYNAILQEQLASVDIGKLLKMYAWQMSPRLGGHFGNPNQNLGDRTQREWFKLRQTYFLDYSLLPACPPQYIGLPVKSHLYKPATLTLIKTANDYDPTHLVQHHRVVAYGFEERDYIPGEYVHGKPNSQIKFVKLYIYDPNYKNDDGVYLSFFVGCDDDWIHLEHSKGDKFTGFFVDDKGRNYLSDELPNVEIQELELAEIISADRAQFDFQFRWECSFIPYFCIQVDGADWQYNDPLKEQFLPDGNIKQCPTRTGSMNVNLKVPRKPSTVAVQLLDDDAFTSSTSSPCAVCMPPIFVAHTYFWDKDERVCEQDFHFEDKDPSESTVEELSRDKTRIVRVHFPAAADESEIAFPWADEVAEGLIPELGFAWGYHLPIKTFLGNIAKPLHANFTVKNFVSPEISATIATTKNGQTTTDSLSSLPTQDALICDGFTPADYADNTEVRITFACTGQFGRVLEDQALLHGRCVLVFSQSCAGSVDLLPIDVFIPTIEKLIPDIEKDIARLEAAGLRLVEMGLLDFKAELEAPTDPHLVLRPPDPATLLKAIRSDRILQTAIDKALQKVWSDRDIWLEGLKHRSGVLSQEYQGGVTLYHPLAKTDTMAALGEREAEIQRQADAVIIGAFGGKALEILRADPAVRSALDRL